MKLYDFQQTIVDKAAAHLTTNAGNPDARLLIASPTGTGKSYMELAIQAGVEGAWIVSPVLEVITGLLQKRGLKVPSSAAKIHELGEQHNIATPMRFRSLLLAGAIQPTAIIWDEGHHHNAETWLQSDLMAGVPSVNFTATPYRGTSPSTRRFRETWGQPTWAITYPQAFQQGYLHMPECRTVPLVDDDLVEMKNGEFVVEAVNEASRGRIDDLADLVKDNWNDRPTMYAAPSTEVCKWLAQALDARGIPSRIINQSTKQKDRQRYIQECLDREVVLLQIRVLGEGVDVRIRRIVDAAPAGSPVVFMQRFGRATRPLTEGEQPSEYICTNRNLLRHGYLLDGVLPSETVLAAQAAFGGFGDRLGGRAIGLENLGRFKATAIPFADGLQGECYVVAMSEGNARREYAALIHPVSPDPIWATRVSGATYGKWARCEPPDGLSGFASINGSAPTDRQKDWWKRSAAQYGLDPEAKITRRNFAVLPILADLGVRIRRYGT